MGNVLYMSYSATDIQSTGFWAIILVLVIWETIWKGIGLWKAARKGQKYWFVAMLVINSLGILPYCIYSYSRKMRKDYSHY